VTTPIPAEWHVEPISASHDCGFLSSGRPEIDSWLADHALRLQNERTCVTYVWADQPPFVSGFLTLTPHRLEDDEVRVSGHAGGALSGYLIAKIGIHENAVHETVKVRVGREPDDFSELPPTVALLIEAVVHATRAAFYAGGRWLFIDTSNEPDHLVGNLEALGFKPIKSEGSPVYFLKLGRPSAS
jgi:hypothetical protein